MVPYQAMSKAHGDRTLAWQPMNATAHQEQPAFYTQGREVPNGRRSLSSGPRGRSSRPFRSCSARFGRNYKVSASPWGASGLSDPSPRGANSSPPHRRPRFSGSRRPPFRPGAPPGEPRCPTSGSAVGFATSEATWMPGSEHSSKERPPNSTHDGYGAGWDGLVRVPSGTTGVTLAAHLLPVSVGVLTASWRQNAIPTAASVTTAGCASSTHRLFDS
jgi:hypothetical protein